MNPKIKKTIFALMPALLLLIVPAVAFADMNFNYTPLEEIPGFDRPSSLSGYVIAIYKFGLIGIGISGVFMITVGAFLYITSAGNSSSANTAKKYISDAIAGVILALISYLLLYIINPNLLNGPSMSVTSYGTPGSSDYGKYPTVDSPLPKDCTNDQWQAAFNNASGGDANMKCLLQATAAIESGCNQQPARTNGGVDCGALQTRASGCGTDCATLEASPEAAVACGKKYLTDNYKNTYPERGNNPAQKIRDYYAGFNGGAGALGKSGSCAPTDVNSYGLPYEKWDCPKDCGGYCPVPERTSRFLNFYNKCAGTNYQ